jgi:hypothetical protein
MIMFWEVIPWTKGGEKQVMIKYCYFIWTQGLILRPEVLWPKYRSSEEWVCQLLIEYVNDKSLVTQEEIDYSLY